MRGLTFSQTGRARGWDSRRTGSAPSTYLRTVTRETPNSLATCRCERPSTNTLWRMTCTWSTLSILSSGPGLDSPASPPIRPSGGSVSERRVDHFPSGAPRAARQMIRETVRSASAANRAPAGGYRRPLAGRLIRYNAHEMIGKTLRRKDGNPALSPGRSNATSGAVVTVMYSMQAQKGERRSGSV